MSRFNLIDEPWIRVVTKDGVQKEVSLKCAFKNAGSYVELAGETETQNFAVLRTMLAVLQTVFSRYDADGNPITEVDEKMRQTYDSYEEEIYEPEELWKALWKKHEFSDVLYRYLDVWHDRFYLFDEKYPFYQVTSEEMQRLTPRNKKPTVVTGRTINREISESQNKKSMFSPVSEKEKENSKDYMTDAQLARWLITFQGYTGLADKLKLYEDAPDRKPSRGWLFDLGGIYAKGNNLYETLVLNTFFETTNDDIHIQKPCWEYEVSEVTDRIIYCFSIDNLAELYTNWSRAVFIDPDLSLPGPVSVEIGKLPKFTSDIYLEPMTIWRLNETGDKKGNHSPKKHRPDEALWRSFGLIAEDSEDEKYRQPGIIRHLNINNKTIGNRIITLQGVSMQDDHNATSWQPVDETVDSMSINDMIITDISDEGWVEQINTVVEKTKGVIEKSFYWFLSNIAQIRDMRGPSKNGFISDGKARFYQDIDGSFRQWLSDLKPEDSKVERINEWYVTLSRIARKEADELVKGAGGRDYTGTVEKGGKPVTTNNGKILNIVTAYHMYLGSVNSILHIN